MNAINVDRTPVAEAVRRVVQAVRPKAKDSIIRRTLLIEPGENAITLYGTGEFNSVMFRDIPCSVDDDTPEIAVDMTRFARLVQASRGELVGIGIDLSSAKVVTKVDKTTAEISYVTGAAFREYIPEPTEFPEDLEDYVKVVDIKMFGQMMKKLLTCIDPKKPYLNGIWTDGDGLFMATDTYKIMSVTLEDRKLGFRGIIPADFFMIIESIPGDEVYIKWEDNQIWARDEAASVVISCHTVSDEEFPATGMLQRLSSVADESEYHVEIQAPLLHGALKRMHGYFGQTVLCSVKFSEKRNMIISGEDDSNQDSMKEVVPYTLVDESEDIAGLSFRVWYSNLAVVTELFGTETFLLHVIDHKEPLHTVAEESGIQLMLTPYWRQTD